MTHQEEFKERAAMLLEGVLPENLMHRHPSAGIITLNTKEEWQEIGSNAAAKMRENLEAWRRQGGLKSIKTPPPQSSREQDRRLFALISAGWLLDKAIAENTVLSSTSMGRDKSYPLQFTQMTAELVAIHYADISQVLNTEKHDQFFEDAIKSVETMFSGKIAHTSTALISFKELVEQAQQEGFEQKRQDSINRRINWGRGSPGSQSRW